MLATDYDKYTKPHIPKIIIETIPHDDQRYETVGDWYFDEEGNLVIKVSQTTSKFEFLVAIHEMIEAMLCMFKGVKEEQVTHFDEYFESMRSDYPEIVKDEEPGDNDNAPYHHEHKMANQVENWLARSCGVDWDEYSKVINGLKQF